MPPWRCQKVLKSSDIFLRFLGDVLAYLELLIIIEGPLLN